MAASATEKDCLLLGLLSGQMREIAVSLARSTTAAGQRKRTTFEYRVHREPVSRTALSFVYNVGSIRLKRIQNLAEGGAVYPDSHGLAGKQHTICTYLM